VVLGHKVSKPTRPETVMTSSPLLGLLTQFRFLSPRLL
jgi:hypothetical protein